MADNKYNEIIERLREAKVDLANAVLTIIDRINKIIEHSNENFDKEQFDELQFLEKKLEEIKEIRGERRHYLRPPGSFKILSRPAYYF